jgi:16S rRNA (uracil1498-N3)-methyltransferase
VNLLLLEPSEVGEEGIAVLSGARATHLRQILRSQPGQDIRVGVIDGGRGFGTILSVDERTVTVECKLEAVAPERPPVDLLLALPRPKVMQRMWAQVAALGVGHILLSNAERVERNYFDTHVLEADVYRPLLVEGLQQACDTRMPIVSIHRRLKVLVEDDLNSLCPRGARLVAHPGSERTFPAALAACTTPDIMARQAPKAPSRVLLAVGPEGGWNDFELRLMRAHGFQTVSMGSRTLRSDTALIALLALLHEAVSTVETTFGIPGR